MYNKSERVHTDTDIDEAFYLVQTCKQLEFCFI